MSTNNFDDLHNKADKKRNVHEGHRDRVRSRIQHSGIDSLPDHELLEYLLFFTIPRGDTNVLAHRLIDAFHGFNNVLNASKEELQTIDGVGPKTAEFLSAMPGFMRRYASCERAVQKQLVSISDVWDKIIPRFLGKNSEEILILAYDSKKMLLAEKTFSDKSNMSVQANIKDILMFAMNVNAVYLVIAHNHLTNSCQPSLEDRTSTRQLKNFLSAMDITLIDHVIVARTTQFYSFHANNEL